MNIKYTARFSVTTTPVLIYRGGTGDTEDGVIPAGTRISSISLLPDATDGTFPDWWIHGSMAEGNWAKVPKEYPIFDISGIAVGDDLYFWIKSDSGTIIMNLYVKG